MKKRNLLKRRNPLELKMGIPKDWMAFLIRCANCGFEIPYGKALWEPLTRTRVCSFACHKEMQSKYAHELTR
jgi:hypothetical protein